MQLPQITEVNGMRVLTTKQLAEMYEVDSKIIQYNFRYNKNKYIVNKHYIEITGDELRQLKTRSEFQSSLKYVKALYLWTEKGALLHAKSLNTNKAWKVYDYLVDFYFRVKETDIGEQKPDNVVYNTKIANPIKVFKTLIRVAEDNGFVVKTCEFQSTLSRIKGNKIGLRNNLTLEQIDYELAYILAYAFIHRDAGDVISSFDCKIYNQRAEWAADMIIKILNAA